MAYELPVDASDPGAAETPAPILADAPEVSPQGQAVPQLPSAAPLVQQTPRLPVPVIPPMPQSPLQSGDPKARFMALAALGFALGQGPRSGTGMGAMQGVLQANQAKHQEDLTAWKFAAQEAEKQQNAVQQQQAVLDRQHEQRIQQTYANLNKDLEKATDEESYQKIIGLYAGGLQAAGYRTTPLALMQQFPYAPPAEDDQIKKKVADYFNSPMVKALPVEQQMAGAVTIKRNGQDVRLPVQEAMKRIGIDAPTTDANGNSLFSALGHGTEAEQAMQRATDEFKVMFGRPPTKGDSKDNDWLKKRADNLMPRSAQATSTDMPYMLNGKPIVAIRTNGRLTYRGQDVTDQVTPYVPPKETNAPDKLVKVEHKGSDGKAVIEWLPQSELKGRVFEKPVGAVVENRIASAQAVSDVGNDIVRQLSDPAFASKIGPAMGRFNTLRDFIGNPPPEFSELAGEIESYSLANMGVHGMRSAQGAEKIKQLLDKKHTPASMISAIKGLQSFSQHFMENEGRAPATTAPANDGIVVTRGRGGQ